MSKENVQGFYDFTRGNEELEKALVEAVVASNIVALAKEKGFEFTQAEHDEFITGIAAGVSKLSDDQLDEVAGGFHIPGMPQIRVECKKCGWSSGWKDINGYYSYTTLTVLHMATQNKSHSKFRVDYR